MKDFPVIPGVEFKEIIKNGYENYFLSSDGHIWNGNRDKLRKMKTYKFCDGEDAVCLLRTGCGGSMFKVKDLLLEFFK